MNSRAFGWRRRRPAYRLMALLTMVSLSLGVLGTIGPTVAQTGTIEDPAADYQMWRDDEIFVPLPSSGQLQSTSYEYNPGDKTLSAPLPYCQPTAVPGSQMAAAAGRIMSPYSDQVVVAYPGSSGNIEVRFADGCNLADPAVSTGPSALVGPASNMPALAAWYDIATGDLDKYPDADFNYRDEVVVAYATPSGHLNDVNLIVAVLDYAANASAPTVTWKASGTIQRSNLPNWAGHDVPVIPLSVVTGDFDGDTHKEIAVAYVMNLMDVGVAVFRYTTTETDGVITHSLNPVSPLTFAMDAPWTYPVSEYQGTMDAAAGDFDGDGKDELAVAAIIYGQTSSTANPRIAVDLKTFKANSSLTMTQVSAAIPYQDSSSGGEFVSGVQLAAGLFKYVVSADPAVETFEINRRQLALATNGSSGAVDLRTLVYDANLTPGLATTDAYQRIPPSGSPPGRLNFWLAAGGFKGLPPPETTTWTPAQIVWSLAFTTWANDGQVLYLFDPDPSTGKLGTTPFTKTLSATANAAKSTSVAPVVAYDYGKLPTAVQDPMTLYGDSQYLGMPLHIVLKGAYMTDYILQEPPKHVFWDPGLKTVVNVSGQDAFTVGTSDTKTGTMTNSHKDTFDYSLGGSESATFGYSRGGIGLLPPKREVSLSESVGFDYQDHSADYHKGMDQRTVVVAQFGTRDDAIKYRVQNIDVWRYPFFGITVEDVNGNPLPAGYFDITIPQPKAETLLSGGTAELDWYQPVHENGNILSYPAPQAGAIPPYTPADMGSYHVPCDDPTGHDCDVDPVTGQKNVKFVTGPILDDPTSLTWTGTLQEVDWSDSNTVTKGHERTYTKNLTPSLDLKGTTRWTVEGPRLDPKKFSLSGDIAFNSSFSWADAYTTETTTNQLTSIKLTVPQGNTGQAYRFYPVFYISSDGTMKVSFAVDWADVDDASMFYWESRYYAQPDPALNLPFRFNASLVTVNGQTQTQWAPNTEDGRKVMRGFFVRQSQPDQDGAYLELAGPPIVGVIVRLEARVYNYSLGQTVDPPGGMKVRFDYVPIESTTHLPDFTKRTTITEAKNDNPHAALGSPYTTIEPLGPRGMTTAVINWDTSQLDLGGKLEQDYRIYVVLDPDNAVPNEKYETESPASRTYAPIDPNTKLPVADCFNLNQNPFPAPCIDPGQNNEGWRVQKVIAYVAGDPRFGTSADVHLEKDALAVQDPSNPSAFLPNTVHAEVGQRLQLRVKVDTDVPGADYAHLLLYDGDPQNGGKLLADKQAFTGNPNGSYVWTEWTPTEPGPHRLFAQVVESPLDTQPGNAIDDLLVVVVQQVRPTPTLTPTATPTTTPTPAATSDSGGGCAITMDNRPGVTWHTLALLAPLAIFLWWRRGR